MNRSLNISLGSKETMNLIDDLEQRLRGHIDRMEQLKLSVAEALVTNVNSTGFSYMERLSADLKTALAEHLGLLCDLNERVKSLQMGTTLLAQPCITQERRLFCRNMNERTELGIRGPLSELLMCLVQDMY